MYHQITSIPPAAGPSDLPLRTVYVPFADGDVDGFQLDHFASHTRLAVFERGAVLPAFEAMLSEGECRVLARAIDRSLSGAPG